jgi:hypothetical protein
MKNGISKKIIIINFCLAAILALIAGSLAAYTSLSNAKRVVSTTGANQLFSSNVLYSYDEENGSPSTRVMSFSSVGTINTFKFTICNYAQGDKTAWATKDIAYELTLELIDAKGEKVTDEDVLAEYKLDGTAFSSLTKIEKTLAYSNSKVAEDEYTVTVPSAYMEDYRIRIIAKSNVNNYSPIGRIISATEAVVSNHWSGTFTDSIVDSDSHKTGELDSINTRISGQENEIMVISWETDYVEIDPWFLKDLGSDNYTITEDTSKKTIKFQVGGENQPNQYHISFFRTTSAKSLNESWEQMKSHITFSYESIENDGQGGN